MFGSMNIGSIFGIRLYIHALFWLLPGLVLFAGLQSGGWAVGLFDLAFILTVFVCVGLHELGHALAARQFGVRTRDITLYPIGGVARLENIPDRPWPEIAIALAGPAVNFIIAAGLGVMLALGHIPALNNSGVIDGTIGLFVGRLLFANVGLAIFNLIPAFPMDGGRVLRALLRVVTDRVTATDIAAMVGSAMAVLMGVIGFLTWQPMLLVLAAAVFMMGRGEAAAVREEEARRRAQRMGGEPPHTFQDLLDMTRRYRMAGADGPETTTRPSQRVDGWEYDPHTQMWTEWRDGYAVRRTREM